MASARKNSIIISEEEYEVLCFIKEGIFGSFTKLMNEKQRDQFLKTGMIDQHKIPYALTFAPSNENKKAIENAKEKDKLEFICNNQIVGHIIFESKFKNDKNNNDIFRPNICSIEDFREICISGEIEIYQNRIKAIKKDFEKITKRLNPSNITAIVSSFDPFHRAHERILRWSIEQSDLVVIFLIESYESNGLSLNLKKRCFDIFAQNYLPSSRVVLIPLHNIKIFASHLNPVLECALAKSFNCNKVFVGQNHAGLGMFFNHNRTFTILDDFAKDYNIEVTILPEFVFCDECKMIVSAKSCPHGAHHHMKYHGDSLKNLLRLGIIPPAVFIRREISALILSELFPNRFHNKQNIYSNLFPTHGILEYRSDKEFYEQLIKLHQMSYMV
ncbi:ATP sulfurylase (sulfate adenylyltransferase) [Campylobacter insulaenigrae]|uniref:Sulfate adenylyltransferase n=2 Tax=Campylobacter insulaenigrae TaxID=260714 RepID=A0A0A8GZP2_9BACT|nr:ATP sulfurylase (sulfate adenylyltransferase) [Campylobacter insulaenigrae]AJC87241.1 sulfate adenylyltransferase [Campylobacter insulaenigrae NCTC 12927]MCR6571045.1 ATP sulfurylase (sulfate adenylyltransferase) [Campylobacter insulaenigrae]MCR6572697.1 ATP sulfurylase (sulfate adenylyltransferase) [Campylobacter insulaenigrae]MCR6574081.1 ATP sulfurylase (sulfate adenylyltransferase) [Campylobacter insulaenigrae]MCR6575423.1 ATP sulfurylase (sulfate adenylyltransferase) [Campylobacter ins